VHAVGLESARAAAAAQAAAARAAAGGSLFTLPATAAPVGSGARA
jgi:hypothetical protein